jgi:hypothetical protein
MSPLSTTCPKCGFGWAEVMAGAHAETPRGEQHMDLMLFANRLQRASWGVATFCLELPPAPSLEAVLRFAETISAQLTEFERAVEEVGSNHAGTMSTKDHEG